MQEYYDDEDGLGLGTVGALAGGALLASPYGRRARKAITGITPEWAAAPLGAAGKKVADLSGRAASAMTGGASDVAARKYRNLMQPALARDAVDRGIGPMQPDSFYSPIKGFVGETLRDNELAKAQAKAGFAAAREFFGLTAPAARVVKDKSINTSRAIKSARGETPFSPTDRLAQLQKAAAKQLPKTESVATKIASNPVKNQEWGAFEKSADFKLLDPNEQAVVKRIYAYVDDIKNPKEALLEYARILRTQEAAMRAEASVVKTRAAAARKPLENPIVEESARARYGAKY